MFCLYKNENIKWIFEDEKKEKKNKKRWTYTAVVRDLGVCSELTEDCCCDAETLLLLGEALRELLLLEVVTVKLAMPSSLQQWLSIILHSHYLPSQSFAISASFIHTKIHQSFHYNSNRHIILSINYSPLQIRQLKFHPKKPIINLTTHFTTVFTTHKKN